MPKKVIGNFNIEWLQILDEHGNCDDQLRPHLNNKEIQRLYESMILARAAELTPFKRLRIQDVSECSLNF